MLKYYDDICHLKDLKKLFSYTHIIFCIKNETIQFLEKGIKNV